MNHVKLRVHDTSTRYNDTKTAKSLHEYCIPVDSAKVMQVLLDGDMIVSIHLNLFHNLCRTKSAISSV
jgi:hypothetical protein